MVNSREKGKVWERKLARMFREVMPGADIRRGIQSRSGEEIADVEVPYFWVEAKHGKQPNPRAALKQAIGDASQGRVPIAVIKDNRKKPFVVMPLDEFLALVEQWWPHFEPRDPDEVAGPGQAV